MLIAAAWSRSLLSEYTVYMNPTILIEFPDNKFVPFFYENRADISCELSSKETIHTKCLALLSMENKRKIYFKISSANIQFWHFNLYHSLG